MITESLPTLVGSDSFYISQINSDIVLQQPFRRSFAKGLRRSEHKAKLSLQSLHTTAIRLKGRGFKSGELFPFLILGNGSLENGLFRKLGGYGSTPSVTIIAVIY